MVDETHWRKLETMYLSAPVNAIYQPAITIRSGAAQVTMELRPEYFHPAQAVHGSVYFKMLDDAAFFAVNSLVDDVLVLTVSFNLYFMRPLTTGRVTASGEVVNGSKRVFVATATLLDSNGKTAASGSGTFMRSSTPLGPGVGYQ